MGLPNQLSVLRIILTPLFVILFLSDKLLIQYISLIVFTVAVLTDWYDGYFARKLDNISEWGKFLDPLADKVLVISGLILFTKMGYIPDWILWVIIIRDIIITSLRLYTIRSTRPVKTNFLGKVKTCGQLIILYYIYLYHLLIISNNMSPERKIIHMLLDDKIITILLYLVTFFTLASGTVYLVKNKYHLRKIAEDFNKIFLSSESGKDI